MFIYHKDEFFLKIVFQWECHKPCNVYMYILVFAYRRFTLKLFLYCFVDVLVSNLNISFEVYYTDAEN